MKLRLIAFVLVTLALAAIVASASFVVAPGEVAVIRRLGRVLPHPWLPGPHLAIPLGVDQVTRVRTDVVRRLSVGTIDVPEPGQDPGAGEYLTGDWNILKTRAVVQYRVADPVAFTLRTADLAPLLARLAEAGLSRALARRGIDGALRTDRVEIAQDVQNELTRAIDRQTLGIAILGVSLTDARPPSEVAPDFAAAQAAESERDRRLQDAKAYASTTITAAHASALARTEQARSRVERRLALAKSHANRFLALLNEVNLSRPLTIRRLYLDALRELLPKVKRKVILTPDEPIDLSILGVQ